MVLNFRRTMVVVLILMIGRVCHADTNNVMDLGKVVVSASRMAQHDYEVASNVTVISQEMIQSSTAQTVDEILKEQLAINVYDNGSSKTTTVDIRGFGDTANRNVLVLVNDRKINPIDISGPDLLQLPLASIERIEIIRGAGSVLYGDNAVGGVINIITKEGKGDLSGRLGGTLGSYKSRSSDVEIGGSVKDVSYYLYSRYDEQGGYRLNSDVLAKDFDSRLSYRFTDILKVDLATFWHEDDYGLPAGLTQAQLETLGRRGSRTPDDFGSTKDRQVQLAFDLTPWPKDIDWGHFVLDLSYRNRDTYGDLIFAGAGELATKRNIDTIGINGKYIFDQEIFGKKFNFVAGIDSYSTDNDIHGNGFSSDDVTISKDEFGAYLFSEYEVIDKLFVNAGTRFNKAYYTFNQRNPPANYVKLDPDVSVSMVGTKYEYAKGSNVFANIQQTFRFLATDEWYDTISGTLNTDLKQQTGVQYEAGVKHNWQDKVTFTLTPYWIDLKHEIFFDPSVSPPFGSNNNYDKTRRVGVDFGQELDVLKFFPVKGLDKLSFFNNYAYENPEFNGGINDGRKIPMAPAQQISTGFNIGFLQHYGISLIGHYVGSRFAINDTLNSTSPLKPYYTVDTKLTYTLKNMDIFFAVNNIANEKYFTFASKSTSGTNKDFFPAPERNFTFGLNFKF